MKRIEDAPKELQDMFEIVWEQVVCSASGISDYRDEIAHVFLKGYEAAIAPLASVDEQNKLIVKDIGRGMTNTDWQFVKYFDSIEHEYGYMLEHTGVYVCPGWMVLIQDMLRELDAEIGSDATTDDHPVLTTIKEKFGTLRVYGYNLSDSEQAILDKYAALSSETCMTCGKPGQMREKGRWLYVACDEHEEGGTSEAQSPANERKE